MDHCFDEFSKSLAESVPRRESPPGATAMLHRAICSLAYLVAVFGILGVARAGSITYDFVNPITGTNGFNVQGSITVDSAGISAAPIDLTSSMVQSWHISVFDSLNVLQLSLASTSDILNISPTNAFNFAPRISTSSLFLPTVPFPPPPPILDYTSNFEPESATLPPHAICGRVLSTAAPSFYDRVSLAQSTPPTTQLFFTFDHSQSDFLIAVAEPASAVIPEPSSVILWGIGGLFLTIGSLRRRRGATAPSRKEAARVQNH